MAWIIPVEDENVLRAVGFASPFKYYVAELPANVVRAVTIGLDEEGRVIDMADFADQLDSLPRTAFVYGRE